MVLLSSRFSTLIPQQPHVTPTDLFNVVKELWPILGPYALLQVLKMDLSTLTLLSFQKHTSEQTPEDLELATSILNYYVGDLEDLSFSKFHNFTDMFDDSFMIFATHRYFEAQMDKQIFFFFPI